jgi:hypothetical protein
MLATNWQQGVGSPLRPGAPSLAEALASLGLPTGSVPEPCFAGFIALATGVVSSRRRRGV